MSAVEPVEPADDGARPARGYSWPPFEVGNTAALSHGAYSERVWSPLAEAIMATALAQASEPGSLTAYLAQPEHRSAVWAWASAEARVAQLSEHVDAEGEGLGLDADGEPTGAAKLLLRWTTTAERARDRLGLSPLARARLGKDVAAAKLDLARLMAEGAASDGPSGASS